ncbi:MAG: hypothetical protein M1140_11860 [Chloroflexi bacterium]|nr:hypothetical protein [Chloroflexota bacterium]
MNENVPDGNDDLPDDELSAEEYREAAESTLQRLMEYLLAFGSDLPAQTNVADLNDPHLAPGAFYSVPGSAAGTYQVIKVLALDDYGVHVCLYGNAFAHRPAIIAPDLLETAPFFSMAPEDAGQEWPLSVGHLPLLVRTFIGMRPSYITQAGVMADELDDYHEWKEAGGGYL